MRNKRFIRNSFKQIFSLILITGVLCGAFSVPAQTKRPAVPTRKTIATKSSQKPPEQTLQENNSAFPTPPAKSPMASVWESGALPEPLPVPAGNTDEIAAFLAQKVAARSSESVPALLTALQLSGFFVTDKNGQLALTPPDGRGLGLPINGWEVASAARMYGDGRQTPLSDMSERLKSIPELKNADVAKFLLEGLRKNAGNKSNAYLRVWARFIIELGKNSEIKYDISNANAAADNIKIDAIQHLLLVRRLFGDAIALSEKYRSAEQPVSSSKSGVRSFGSKSGPEFKFLNAGYSRNSFDNSPTTRFSNENLQLNDEAQKQIPCRMDGNAPTIMDAAATVSGVGFDKFYGYLEDVFEGANPQPGKIGKFTRAVGTANIILAYAKFVQSYAALETKIVAEDSEPLIRTKNALAGARKRLKAEVRMNIGNWQMYNCVRMALNVTAGIDFATLNDGPIGDVGVQWALTEGGGGDRYSNSTGINKMGEQIVGFAADAPRRIQDKGVGVGVGTTGIRAGNLTFTKTDNNGIAENILEGTPQRNAKIGKVSQVKKQARVVTSIKLKAGEIKGDMVDVAGQAIAGIPGLITMPAELLYRTSWAASGALIVPVVDWEECTGGWSGTISISRRSSEFKDYGGGKGVRTTTESSTSLRTFEYKGTINIENAPETPSGDRSKTVSYWSVDLKGESNATSEIINEDKKTSFYHDNCGQRMTKRTLFRHDRDERRGEGQSIAEGGLLINLINNTYRFHITIPRLPGKFTRTNLYRPSGYCRDEDNKAQDRTSESSIEIDPEHIEISDGVLDPKNPDVIEGNRSFTKNDGEEVEIKWSLRRCR